MNMINEISKLVKKAGKFIILMLALIYIVSPIDLLPANPLDDIIVGLIAFLMVFGEFDLGNKLLGAKETKKALRK